MEEAGGMHFAYAHDSQIEILAHMLRMSEYLHYVVKATMQQKLPASDQYGQSEQDESAA
jgi:hypothetical protein